MKSLNEVLERLGDPLTTFVSCVNISCPEYQKMMSGSNSKEVFDKMTFFYSSLQNLENPEIKNILQDAKVVKIFKDEKNEIVPEISIYYIYVSYPIQKYYSARERIKEFTD